MGQNDLDLTNQRDYPIWLPCQHRAFLSFPSQSQMRLLETAKVHWVDGEEIRISVNQLFGHLA
jgi:hypothetical protein